MINTNPTPLTYLKERVGQHFKPKSHPKYRFSCILNEAILGKRLGQRTKKEKLVLASRSPFYPFAHLARVERSESPKWQKRKNSLRLQGVSGSLRICIIRRSFVTRQVSIFFAKQLKITITLCILCL